MGGGGGGGSRGSNFLGLVSINSHSVLMHLFSTCRNDASVTWIIYCCFHLRNIVLIKARQIITHQFYVILDLL